jgi:hypothetical protein
MLKYGQEYVRQSKETYEQAYQQRLKKNRWRRKRPAWATCWCRKR